MKKILLLAALSITTISLHAQKGEEAAIRALLTAQVQEWNSGNIAGYMHGYWESDSLVFIGKNGPTYGYAATLARYRKSYPDTAAMGKLISAIISMERLSEDYYFAIGKWELNRSAGNLSGSWTLLFRKIKGAWVIVVDHSS